MCLHSNERAFAIQRKSVMSARRSCFIFKHRRAIPSRRISSYFILSALVCLVHTFTASTWLNIRINTSECRQCFFPSPSIFMCTWKLLRNSSLVNEKPLRLNLECVEWPWTLVTLDRWEIERRIKQRIILRSISVVAIQTTANFQTVHVFCFTTLHLLSARNEWEIRTHTRRVYFSACECVRVMVCMYASSLNKYHPVDFN